MYYLLSILSGILISVMIMFNGQLSEHYGVYPSLIIIHLIGLLFTLIMIAIKKERFSSHKNIPFYYYLGGAVGILTVLFNNLSFGRISISAILAIGLLGQSITSLIFDKYGFFNMPKKVFHKKKLIGIGVVFLGIIIMTSFYKISAAVPIILSLLTGFTVVLSRTMNAGLAEKTNVLRSTLYCYIVGLIGSVALLLIFSNNSFTFSDVSISSNVLIYLGGIFGVVIISILNATVAKISSFHMTLLLFLGQIFSSIIVDMILMGSFSVPNFIGGIFVVLGLSINVWIDKREKLRLLS